MSWFSEERRQGKEGALRALKKWKNKKTKENRCKYEDKRIQYKVIIENEKKKWQEWNTENIKKLLDKKDNTQLWRGIRNLIQTKGRGYEIDPGRVREYFWRLLGGDEMELGVHHEEGILGNAVVEELDRKIEREEINIFLRNAKNRKAVEKMAIQWSFGKK
jgi:hypothetical protein